MGVVYYGNYFTYFEVARVEYLRDLGVVYAQMEKDGVFLAVFEAYCKYKASARYDDLLVARTWVSKLKHARAELSYEIWRENETQLVVEGRTTLVCVDTEGKPMLIPKQISDLLKKEMDSQ